MNLAELSNAYLDALCAADMDAITSYLHEDVVVDLPMSLTGEPVPMFTFAGKKAAMDYLGSIAANFSQVRFDHRRTFSADDAKTVFVEAVGNLIQHDTNASYRNIYCFKITISDGRIYRVSEYTNPIAWGKLMNLKLG